MADNNVKGASKGASSSEEVVSDRILTIPNLISMARLVLAFVAFYVLMTGSSFVATVIFAFTAATDFLDGQIARRTGSVSKLGQLLDPAVDRILMLLGVFGLLLLGRLPLWIVLVVLARDLLVLAGGAVLLSKYNARVPVVYAGKIATTLLFVGLAGLMLNAPMLPGLGWTSLSELPGFNSVASSWGIWAVYLGLLISLGTTVYYIKQAIKLISSSSN